MAAVRIFMVAVAVAAVGCSGAPQVPINDAGVVPVEVDSGIVPVDAGGFNTQDPMWVSVETTSPESYVAGDKLTPACALVDGFGDLHPVPDFVDVVYHVLPEGAVVRDLLTGNLVVTKTGAASVACEVPSVGLVDTSPAAYRVSMGTIMEATVVAPATVTAGVAAGLGCEVVDEYGNSEVIFDAAFEAPTATVVLGNEVTWEGAGTQPVTCSVPGAIVHAGVVTVSPGDIVRVHILPGVAEYWYSACLGGTYPYTLVANDVYANVVETTFVFTADLGALVVGSNVTFNTTGNTVLRATAPNGVEDVVIVRVYAVADCPF